MMNWLKSLKGKVGFKEPLKNHTTFRIGGPAKFFIEPSDCQDLKQILAFAKKNHLRIFLLGAGSNILASDEGIEGIVLKLNSLYFRKIVKKNCSLEVGSGCLLGELLKFALKQGLSGMEFLAGIPGTVGGALAMNAGAWGKNMGDIIEKVVVMDYNGNTKILYKKEIKFNYRKSSLAKYIILSCTIRLAKAKKEEINASINKYVKLKINSQDSSYPNAGCIFKNPSASQPAGRLIDLCSLKNKSVGGASISNKHANFIVNRSNAKARDVLKLIGFIQAKVKQRFNINLEPEIKIWR